jgi:hypothetical protein
VVAASALERGDPLGALPWIARREDPHGLALRGIALAQLEELGRARELLARAARAFAVSGDALHEARARAACAEVAAAERDLPAAERELGESARVLRALGDRDNAAWAEIVRARLLLLAGDARGAAGAVAAASTSRSAVVGAVRAVARAEACLWSLDARGARRELARARALAARADNRIVAEEIARLAAALDAPVARRVGGDVPLDVGALSRVLAERGLVIDGCRRRVLASGRPALDLARRPVLWRLLEALARAHPAAVPADTLVTAAFAPRVSNASYRARLRVELGRLRALLGRRLGTTRWDRSGHRLRSAAGPVTLIEPLAPADSAVVEALLADGRAWSAPSLAEASGLGIRTVQRVVGALQAGGRVVAVGRARSRRYARPSGTDRIASQMLLLGIARTR